MAMTTLTGIRCIDELALSNQRVFLRVDLDVAPDESNADQLMDARIEAVLPTMRLAMDNQARLVVATHRGRPRGRVVESLGLESVGLRLAELSGWDVLLPDGCTGDGARKAVADLRAGQVVLLENLRFDPGEEANDEVFARGLLQLADVYVNDALTASSRSHASVQALPLLMRERGMGLVLRDELSALERLDGRELPLVAVLGGTRWAERVELISALMGPERTLCLGGTLATTFVMAERHQTGPGVASTKDLSRARSLWQTARDRGTQLVLPTDVMVTEGDKELGLRSITEVAPGQNVVDLGPESRAIFGGVLAKAKTALWVGAMGLAGHPVYAEGTRSVARMLAESNAFSVVVGSAALAACQQLPPELQSRLGHRSAGGGAALAILEGRSLPGLSALAFGV